MCGLGLWDKIIAVTTWSKRFVSTARLRWDTYVNRIQEKGRPKREVNSRKRDVRWSWVSSEWMPRGDFITSLDSQWPSSPLIRTPRWRRKSLYFIFIAVSLSLRALYATATVTIMQKARHYIARMGVVDCVSNRLSWSFGWIGTLQRFRPWLEVLTRYHGLPCLILLHFPRRFKVFSSNLILIM